MLLKISRFSHRISLKNLVYIGLRSIDPYERLIAKKFNMNLYGMRVSICMIYAFAKREFIEQRADSICTKSHTNTQKALDAGERELCKWQHT